MAKARICREKIDLNKLSDSDKSMLSDRLFSQIFDRIWSGFSRDQFHKYFFEGQFPLNRIYLFKSEQKIVGYLIVKFVHIDIRRRKYSIFRVSANVLPKYTGNQLVTWPVFLESCKCFLTWALTPRRLFIFLTSNSPASYCAMYKRTRKIYPSPDQKTPGKILELLPSLSEKFNLNIETHSPFVCRFSGVGLSNPYIVKQQENNLSEGSLFYKKLCPDYSEGQALITLLPLDIVSGLLETMNQIQSALKNKFKNIFKKQKNVTVEP